MDQFEKDERSVPLDINYFGSKILHSFTKTFEQFLHIANKQQKNSDF